MMRVLVTGATGFLGKALVSALERQGHEVIGLGSKHADLTQSGSLDDYSDRQYDQIYHLAAWTQAGEFALHHAGEQWIINQQINSNVLAWWRERHPQAKLICIGTSCAYPPEAEHVEENYLSGQPIDSLYTYAMTKRMLYVGLLALHKQFGMQYLCVVPSTLYGPGYHTDDRQMHFIFDLIRKIIRGKLYGDPVVLWGDGYQKRELVYLDDFVTAMAKLAMEVDNELVNVGAGEEFSIRYFARLICDKVGYDFDAIQFDTSRYVGALSKCLVVHKLSQYLPNLSMRPLDVGMDRTIEWLRSEQETLLAARKE